MKQPNGEAFTAVCEIERHVRCHETLCEECLFNLGKDDVECALVKIKKRYRALMDEYLNQAQKKRKETFKEIEKTLCSMKHPGWKVVKKTNPAGNYIEVIGFIPEGDKLDAFMTELKGEVSE